MGRPKFDRTQLCLLTKLIKLVRKIAKCNYVYNQLANELAIFSKTSNLILIRYQICDAEKRNQFSFVSISFNTLQKLVNFFTYNFY